MNGGRPPPGSDTNGCCQQRTDESQVAPIRQSMNRCPRSAKRLHAGRRVRRIDSRFARQVRKLLIEARELPFREFVVPRGIHFECSVSNAMSPARERSAHLRYGELTFNGTQMVFAAYEASQG